MNSFCFLFLKNWKAARSLRGICIKFLKLSVSLLSWRVPDWDFGQPYSLWVHPKISSINFSQHSHLITVILFCSCLRYFFLSHFSYDFESSIKTQPPMQSNNATFFTLMLFFLLPLNKWKREDTLGNYSNKTSYHRHKRKLPSFHTKRGDKIQWNLIKVQSDWFVFQ